MNLESLLNNWVYGLDRIINHFLHKKKDTSEDKEYDGRFSEEHKNYLKEKNCPPSIANNHEARFNANDIISFVKIGCSPEKSSQYPLRFSGKDVSVLYREGISPLDSLKYFSFHGKNIARLHRLGGPSKAREYTPLFGRSFSDYEVIALLEADCPPRVAREYNEKFGGEGIAHLYKVGCSPDISQEYNPRFDSTGLENPSGIAELFRIKCFPETANKYDYRFDFLDIFRLFSNGCQPEKANSYPPTFTAEEIDLFHLVNCSPEKSLEYGAIRQFNGREIVELHKAGCTLTEVFPWRNSRFTGEEIAILHKSGCSLEIADQYNKSFDGFGISFLYKLKVFFDAEIETQRKLYLAYKKIDESFNRERVFSFISVGSHSAILHELISKHAWKFSEKVAEEYRLFLQLKERGCQFSNIIKIQDYSSTYKNYLKSPSYFGEFGHEELVCAMGLEYISGKSLHQILKDEGKLSLERTVHYSSGILNGLLELRQVGIWHHRDIKPANIMIDEEKDRAVIIDLGIATSIKDASARGNRRFGSPSGKKANDLISLGQVVYKMAAGEHIFAESKSMEMTTYADKLRDHRDWIYERPEERLPPYLRRVEETVKDSGLCGIVKFCLASEGTEEEYQQLRKKFGGSS